MDKQVRAFVLLSSAEQVEEVKKWGFVPVRPSIKDMDTCDVVIFDIEYKNKNVMKKVIKRARELELQTNEFHFLKTHIEFKERRKNDGQ